MELVSNSMSSNILFYKTAQGEARIEVIFNGDTFWMSQKRMADLFGVDVRTVNYHLKQIFDSGELSEGATIRKIGIVQSEGERDVERTPLFYNLDVIIAVGYRVNSYQATQFRIWATSVLREFLVKGLPSLGRTRQPHYQLGFSGDIYDEWSAFELLPHFTATASNVGYGYWGHDLGGHMQKTDHDTDPELYTRWLQFGVFTPIFKTHSTESKYLERKFWEYPTHYEYLKAAVELRYALTPYIYTMSREAYDTGVSICRPL